MTQSSEELAQEHIGEAEDFLKDARRLFEKEDPNEVDVEYAKLNALLSIAHSNLAFVYKL